MKARKRLLSGLLAVCMFISLCSISGAVSVEKEIVISDDIDSKNTQFIIAALNGEEIIAPRSFICVFGHSLARGTVYEIYHRYFSTAPRCLMKTYDVTYCTRLCGYNVGTLIGQGAILCCS